MTVTRAAAPFGEEALAEPWARRQDEADPLRRFREEFELPAGRDGTPMVYFCGHSLGLMPRTVRGAVDGILDSWARRAVDGHFTGPAPWYGYEQALREPLAALAGARAAEVIPMNTLTVDIHLMLVSFYRPTAERYKVIVEEAAFPSDTYAVTSHLSARGVDPARAIVVARPRPGEATLRTEDLEALIEREGKALALVFLGGVHYYTGQLQDLARITRAAHRAGAMAGFDLAHAMGNVPLSLHDWDADFAVWCSYKYLNSGPGTVGGCFVHERHGNDLAIPRFAGWWGNDPATRFRMHLNESFVPVEGAAGWQVSGPPMLSLAPLTASLPLFLRAGLPALRAKSERLTGYLEYLTERWCGGRVEVITPADPAWRGAQLSFLIPGRARAVFDALKAADVLGDYREPDVVRLAPIPLYNTFHEVWRAGRALADACR